MLNIRKKCVVLNSVIICMNKTYCEYIPRKVNIRLNIYILQYEDNSYNWDNVKMDPVKTEVNTEYVKTEEKH